MNGPKKTLNETKMTIKPLEKDWFVAEGWVGSRWYQEYGKSSLEALERLFISINFAE